VVRWDAAVAQLWRHVVFLTDLEGTAVDLDAFHRAHAVVELCINDWKEGAAIEHSPRCDFSVNSAWMFCAVLVPNLIRWSAKLGRRRRHAGRGPDLQTRYFSVLPRLVNPELRHCAGLPLAVGTRFTNTPTDLRAVAFHHLSGPSLIGAAAGEPPRANNRQESHLFRTFAAS
jgi:hypothetical protein